MAEKKLSFKNPLEGSALFADQSAEETTETAVKKKMGRPRKDGVVRESGAAAGLQKGTTRYTVIFEEKTLNDLKNYARINNITIKAALTHIINVFMDDYRKDPEKVRADAEKRINDFMSGSASDDE